MKRTENAIKNIATIWAEKFIVIIVSFVLRTVFIKTLGIDYVGLDGLFTNILSMLSLSELGVGIAMTYSMYKPISEGDNDKLVSIMRLYKNVYRVIALIIILLGMLLLPILHLFINEPPSDINVYYVYLGFLINTALSYLFTYKRSVLTAHQQAYKYTLIDTLSKIIILGIQCAALLLFKSYYLYLIVGIVCTFSENAIVSFYVDRLFPFLKSKDVKKLDFNEKSSIIKNIKALFLHKFGDFAINSTDNMIISAVINVTTVGMVSNYNLIISGINTFVNNFFSSLSAGIGNLIVEENREKQFQFLEKLNFIGFWIYGFAAVCFYFLLSPLVQALWGEELALSWEVVVLMAISQYLTGMRVPLSTFKTAAGIYKQDKFVPLIQAAVNLVISIVAVIYIGLPGVFLGTIASSVLVASWNRPYIVYKYAFNISPKRYFQKYAVQIVFIVAVILLLRTVFGMFPSLGAWPDIFIKVVVCTVVYNGFLMFLFFRTPEFSGLLSMLKKRLLRRKK